MLSVCHDLNTQGFKEMGGISGVGLSVDLESWRQRVIWLRQQDMKSQSSSPLPDLSDDSLKATATSWLIPHLGGCRSKSDMQKLAWSYILKVGDSVPHFVCCSSAVTGDVKRNHGFSHAGNGTKRPTQSCGSASPSVRDAANWNESSDRLCTRASDRASKVTGV